MSIQTQIDRINQAKADILTALTEKGVDTTGAGLADIAALVSAIESGGNVEIVDFTPAASDNQSISISTPSDKVGAVFFMVANGEIDETAELEQYSVAAGALVVGTSGKVYSNIGKINPSLKAINFSDYGYGGSNANSDRAASYSNGVIYVYVGYRGFVIGETYTFFIIPKG